MSLFHHPSLTAITTTTCEIAPWLLCHLPFDKIAWCSHWCSHFFFSQQHTLPCNRSRSLGPTRLLPHTHRVPHATYLLLADREPLAPTAVCMQEEACRLAEQVHALEDTRSRWNAEVAAKEASLAAKEEAMAADSRQRDADQRRRLAQEHQVCICTCT